jgi:hypothetical protein
LFFFRRHFPQQLGSLHCIFRGCPGLTWLHPGRADSPRELL